MFSQEWVVINRVSSFVPPSLLHVHPLPLSLVSCMGSTLPSSEAEQMLLGLQSCELNKSLVFMNDPALGILL